MKSKESLFTRFAKVRGTLESTSGTFIHVSGMASEVLDSILNDCRKLLDLLEGLLKLTPSKRTTAVCIQYTVRITQALILLWRATIETDDGDKYLRVLSQLAELDWEREPEVSETLSVGKFFISEESNANVKSN